MCHDTCVQVVLPSGLNLRLLPLSLSSTASLLPLRHPFDICLIFGSPFFAKGWKRYYILLTLIIHLLRLYMQIFPLIYSLLNWLIGDSVILVHPNNLKKSQVYKIWNIRRIYLSVCCVGFGILDRRGINLWSIAN